MIKQIEDSIDWDCKVEFYEEAKAKYEGPFDAEEFLKKDISKVKENIEYYEREMNSDKEREDNRGEWVIDLVNSLNMSTEEKEELLDFDV